MKRPESLVEKQVLEILGRTGFINEGSKESVDCPIIDPSTYVDKLHVHAEFEENMGIIGSLLGGVTGGVAAFIISGGFSENQPNIPLIIASYGFRAFILAPIGAASGFIIGSVDGWLLAKAINGIRSKFHLDES